MLLIMEFHWIIQIILSAFSIDYFYVKIFALGRSVSLFFGHANAKLAPKHWTIIVIESITNFRFRSSTVESCVCLWGRIVPVLNNTHGLSRIIHQLLYVSLCVYSISLLNLSIFFWSFILPGRQRSRSFRSLALNLAFTSVIAILVFAPLL